MKDLKAILSKVERLAETADAVRKSLIALIEQHDADTQSDKQSDICLFCKKPVKPGTAVTRGICRSTCYREARQMVVENKTTWEALEKANLILPVGRTKTGRPKARKLSKTEIERLEKLASKSSGRKSS